MQKRKRGTKLYFKRWDEIIILCHYFDNKDAQRKAQKTKLYFKNKKDKKTDKKSQKSNKTGHKNNKKDQQESSKDHDSNTK